MLVLTPAAACAFVAGPMKKEPAGRYYRNLLDEFKGRFAELLLADPALRTDFCALLREVAPPIQSYLRGGGDRERVPRALAERLDRFAAALADADREAGGDRLAKAIEKERAAIQVDDVAGKDLNAVRDFLNRVVEHGPRSGED